LPPASRPKRNWYALAVAADTEAALSLTMSLRGAGWQATVAMLTCRLGTLADAAPFADAPLD
jgi:hypothetical protein